MGAGREVASGTVGGAVKFDVEAALPGIGGGEKEDVPAVGTEGGVTRGEITALAGSGGAPGNSD